MLSPECLCQWFPQPIRAGVLIFDVIGLGEPSLAGRTWSSGDDWGQIVPNATANDS
jgi:hypothetical protein